MTLKQKFEEFTEQKSYELINYNAQECELIADDYAIEFVKWVDLNYFKHNTFTQTTSTEEMLNLFKKEKGL